MHWTKRKREVDRIHSLVHNIVDNDEMFESIVDIKVTAYFKNRPLDSSNICGKIYEDGLCGSLIADDSIEYVREFTTVSRVDKNNPRVEIEVKAV